MSYQDFRIVTTSRAGNAANYAVDDFKELFNILNGQVINNRKIKLAIPTEILRKLSFRPFNNPTENPEANELWLMNDNADKKLKIKTSTGSLRTIAFIDDITAGGTTIGQNIGTGIGIYKTKVGDSLQLRSINSLDSIVTAALSADTNSIQLALSGTVPVSKGGTGLTAIGAKDTLLHSNGSAAQWATPANIPIRQNPKDLLEGVWQAGNLTTGYGFFQDVTVSGTVATVIDSGKPAAQFTTGATSGNIAGFKTNQPVFRTDNKIEMWMKGKTTANTTRRIYIGFSSDATLPSADDFLNGTKNGFGLRYAPATTDALQLHRNNNDTTSGSLTLQTPYNLAYFTLYLAINPANSEISYSLNDAAIATTTSNSPINGIDMYFHAMIQTTTAATRAMQIPFIYVRQTP